MSTFTLAKNQREMQPNIRPHPTGNGWRVAVIVMTLLVSLIIIITMLPVLLLFVFTSVPPLISVTMVLVDLCLIAALLRLNRTVLLVGGIELGMLIVSVLAIALSQAFASTPAIVDARGNPFPNSIASLEEVNLNGTRQWITLRGKDVNNPLLLYLGAGGPGAGGFATRSMFEPLEDHFVVVSWDEPGTAKSYNAVPISALTPDRYIADAHALTELLRERFHQDKIYIYGVSWTSILGIWMIQRYPELYAAYVGNGQMVNTTENDVMGYEFAIQYETQRGDTATVEMLQRNGPPPYTGDGLVMKYVAYLDVLNDYMGSPRYTLVAPLMPMFSTEYGLIDRVNHLRGLYQSFETVYPQLQDVDFTTQAARLDVPVYFFVGRQDVNAMASLVEGYYNVLQAPHKELIWFEHAGHGLNRESMNQFVDVMVNTVLAQNQTTPE